MIPGYGTVSYNGYDFPPTYEMDLECEPEYISGTEVVRYYVNTLSISFILTNELSTLTNSANSIDNQMQDIRLRLQEPRRELSFTYQGSGFRTSVTSGTGALTDDINGGPLPQINSWEPIGTNAAARIRWSVVFYTTYCLNTSGNFNDLISFSMSHVFNINEDGTARIIRSFEAIKKHKAVGFDPDYIAHIDSNRDIAMFIPNLPLGFKRTKQAFTISPNGRKLTAEIVDDEEPSNNSAFPYAIKVEADHSLESSLMPSSGSMGGGFLTWDNDISASIQLAPGYSSGMAWQIFLWILYQRYHRLNVYSGPGALPKNEKNNKDRIRSRSILTSLRMKESIFTRTHTFTAKYYGIYDLDALFLQTGMFTQVHTMIDANGLYPWQSGYTGNLASEWILYRTTVSDTVHTPMGYRRAGIDPSQGFVLFDPCASLYQNVGANPNLVATLPTGSIAPIYHPSQSQSSTPSQNPSLYESGTANYVKYRNNFSLSERTRVYDIGIQDISDEIKNYKSTTSAEAGGINANDPLVGGFTLNGKTGGSAYSSDSAYTGIGGGSVFTLTMRGFAIRHGAAAPCPAVVQFAGQPVKRIGNPLYESNQITEGVEPLYLTKWEVNYLIPFQFSGNIFQNVQGNVFSNDYFEKSV